MPTKQEQRAEETKRTILAAAGQLFAERGFDSVTMREIAKAAGCSHTTIYIYFKDKEALLHQLSMDPLQLLREQMESILSNCIESAESKLKSITRTIINFCLSNRNMYTILFFEKSIRVDEEAPLLEINQLRNHMFGLLRQAIQACMQQELTNQLGVAFARIYFYTLNGIIGTYTMGEESVDQLLGRLAPTFELAVDVLLNGFRIQTNRQGDEWT